MNVSFARCRTTWFLFPIIGGGAEAMPINYVESEQKTETEEETRRPRSRERFARFGVFL